MIVELKTKAESLTVFDADIKLCDLQQTHLKDKENVSDTEAWLKYKITENNNMLFISQQIWIWSLSE